MRQGCPLSPLIYAPVAAILMDKIEQDCPHTTVRAYADDTALTLRDFRLEAPVSAIFFRKWRRFIRRASLMSLPRISVSCWRFWLPLTRPRRYVADIFVLRWPLELVNTLPGLLYTGINLDRFRILINDIWRMVFVNRLISSVTRCSSNSKNLKTLMLENETN